ncbi:hypothetical protein GOP47_0025728 [Adiantum capillus-veneris]|uniref:SAP domain-containing protein n=1 Tax=Adiantum capillus-veneris TaxID=13818 RepID=A0A9D4Z373_ADICA|nr:hypothetical protein GOP47_0025728 [Adiantum capillus-veneris]
MASLLWKTSFILRAHCPLSLDHEFLRFRLFTHAEYGDDLHLMDYSSADHHLLLQWLCLSLLRSAAAPATNSTMPAASCVAFPDSLTAISVVFPKVRRMEMKYALQHFLTNFSEMRLDCTLEEECSYGCTMENALLCGLREVLVCDGWMVFADNLASHGGVKEWLDGTLMEAVAFSVRTEVNGCIDFVLSPDVIRFHPFKIERLLIGPLKSLFDDGAVVIFNDYLENFPPDEILEMKCLVLPSMQEGFVSGCCRTLPKELDLSKQRKIWNEKHGIVLPSGIFYIRVSFPIEGNKISSWFPSCLVLRGSGFFPALPSIRAARSHSIISKVTSSISRWDFFSFGKLKLQPLCQSVEGPESPLWTTANLKLKASEIKLNYSDFEHVFSVPSIEAEALLSCFRRPKLASCYYSVTESPEASVSDMPETCNVGSSGCPDHSKNTLTKTTVTNLRVPVFLKRKIGAECSSAVKQKMPLINKTSSSMEHGKSLTKKCQQGDSKAVTSDSLGTISVPKDRVSAGSKRTLCDRLQHSSSKLMVEVSDTILLKKRAPVCPRPSMQKPPTPSLSLKVSPDAKSGLQYSGELCSQDKVLLAENSRAEQAASKLKDQNDSKGLTSRQKKAAGGEKKSTTSTINSTTNKNKVLSKHGEGKLSDLTIPELKLFLSENKTKVSGKKDELLQRIVQLLSSS